MPSWRAEGRIYFVHFVLNVNKVKNRTYDDDDDDYIDDDDNSSNC
jgi:hypothetical protein